MSAEGGKHPAARAVGLADAGASVGDAAARNAAIETRRRPWPLLPELLLVAALGGLYSLPFVHTQAWALSFACLGGLAWRAIAAGPGRAALLGLAFGTVWLTAGTWWLFISMHRYGGLAAPLAALAVALLSLALSGYLALALALFARWRRGDAWRDALLLASLWLGAELARGLIFTGFPWVASGYSQVDAPLAALAPWLGVYGIGFVMMLLAAVLAAALASDLGATMPGPGSWRRRGLDLALVLAALLLVPLLLTRDFTSSEGRLSVSLLQTNVAQDQKFALERMPEALARLEVALQQARGSLVVAPETAIPILPSQLGDEAWARFTQRFTTGEQAALIGLPLGSYEEGYTNSVAGISARTSARAAAGTAATAVVGTASGIAGQAAAPAASAPAGIYRYDKHHLVPFGEFIPPGFRWFVELMNIPLGDFNRGVLVAPSFEVVGPNRQVQRVAPNICYEDLFGEELARRFVPESSAPTILVNISNIGWFGNTIAIEQHLNISRLRTLELQRPMLRATNTGATALVDHRGRVLAALAPFTHGTLELEVEGRSGNTPFAAWAGRFGLWPYVAWVLLVLAACELSRRRAAPSRLRG